MCMSNTRAKSRKQVAMQLEENSRAYIALAVSDLGRFLRFYTDVLGIENP